MVSVDKEYEFCSSQVRYHNERIIEAFQMFVKIFSAIAGGSVYLSLQKEVATKASVYVLISDLLVILVAFIAIVMVLENLRGWRGYRSAQSRLGGLDESGSPRIPPPRLFRPALAEGCMILGVIAASAGFWLFNPFKI
jgi:hypothetical protein